MTSLMKTAAPHRGAAAIRPPRACSERSGVQLSDVETARISAAIDAARTESTREVYAAAWRGWQRWCEARGVAALPGDPWALCAYLTERAESGRAMGTLDLSCVAIRHVHRTCGADDPVDDEAVRQVRLGLRRLYGGAPRRLARPLTLADVRKTASAIDRSTPIGIRDAAMILLGYASAMRRSELVALQLADVEHKPAGLLLNVRRSKTDQEGHGQLVAVAYGRHSGTDPVAALAAWRAIRGETPGPLFTRIWASKVASSHCRHTCRPGCCAPAPKPSGWTAHGSPPTRCAPATPPRLRWPESRSTASLRRPATGTSPFSSIATFARSRRSRRPRAATSGCEWMPWLHWLAEA